MTGGVESILATHARLLRKAGHQVRVIAGRGEAEIVPELDSRQPEVEALAAGLAEGEFDSSSFEQLRSGLKRSLEPLLADRDVAIAHNLLTMPFNLPAAAALLDTGQRLLAWTHDLAWVNPRYAAYKHRGWPWSMLCEAQRGVRYVAISGLRQRQITHTFGLQPRQVPVVPNGIDLTGFLGISGSTQRLLEKAGLSRADPLVLVPLRITPRKRLELAIEAAGLLQNRLPSLGVLVTGPLGPHSPDNLEYAKHLLELRGSLGLDDVVAFCFEQAGDKHPVSDANVAELYRLADAVLLPSESEGFGLPVLEGGLARSPVVCTDLEVLKEVGGGGIWTFPAKAGAEAVAAAVSAALASRAARLRRRVRRQYSWGSVLNRLERLL